jgi:hypothetical protein
MLNGKGISKEKCNIKELVLKIGNKTVTSWRVR